MMLTMLAELERLGLSSLGMTNQMPAPTRTMTPRRIGNRNL